MTRNNSVNFTGPLQYPIADAATDLFKKEDVQVATKALDLHDHTTGKGLPIPFATAIPNGTITSAMIADGTIDTVDLKDGSVTSAKIADGTIATADHAAASITNALLAADTARANLLTNGGFEIWQRGNGPFTVTGAYTADRWLTFIQGTSTMSVTRNTVGQLGKYCASVVYTHNTVSLLYQKITDTTLQAATAVSLSMRINVATANAVAIQLSSDGTGATSPSSATHPGDGTWRTLTVSCSVPGDATFVQCAIVFTASCTANIDNAMLVVGSQAADYAPLHPADDLARCLRYYEPYGWSGNTQFINGQGTGPQVVCPAIKFVVQKAVTPTMTSSGTWNYQVGSGSASNGSATFPYANAQAFGWVVNAAGTNGTTYLVYPSPGTAWFYAEANP